MFKQDEERRNPALSNDGGVWQSKDGLEAWYKANTGYVEKDAGLRVRRRTSASIRCRESTKEVYYLALGLSEIAVQDQTVSEKRCLPY